MTSTTAARSSHHAHREGQWPALAVSFAAVAVVSIIGSLVTDTGPGSWYADLEQPSWNPPDWLFAPVWSVLYAAMAVAAWLVWRTGERRALLPYGVQLALNLAWTLTFFGAQSTWGGVAVIAALVVAIVVTIVEFGRVHQVAAWLLVPYLAWTGYAAALTTAIASAS